MRGSEARSSQWKCLFVQRGGEKNLDDLLRWRRGVKLDESKRERDARVRLEESCCFSTSFEMKLRPGKRWIEESTLRTWKVSKISSGKSHIKIKIRFERKPKCTLPSITTYTPAPITYHPSLPEKRHQSIYHHEFCQVQNKSSQKSSSIKLPPTHSINARWKRNSKTWFVWKNTAKKVLVVGSSYLV